MLFEICFSPVKLTLFNKILEKLLKKVNSAA